MIDSGSEWVESFCFSLPKFPLSIIIRLSPPSNKTLVLQQDSSPSRPSLHSSLNTHHLLSSLPPAVITACFPDRCHALPLSTNSARPSGYRDVERGLSGSPCSPSSVDTRTNPFWSRNPVALIPPVRAPVTRRLRPRMKTEDDAADFISTLPPAPSDSTAADADSGPDPDSHLRRGSSTPTARGPPESPTKSHLPRRTVCDHCRRRRM